MNLTPGKKKIIEIAKQVFESNGNVTLDELAKACSEAGLINSATRKPYTRSTMHYTLKTIPELQKYRLDKNNQRRPLIIMMARYPKLSEWMAENIPGEIIDEATVTFETAKDRDVYGTCDLPIMLQATKVWWPVNKRGALVEDKFDDSYMWRMVKFEVLY